MAGNRKEIKVSKDAKKPSEPKDRLYDPTGQGMRNPYIQMLSQMNNMPVVIPGNTMGTDGYGNMPLYVQPNNGQPMYIPANSGNHHFPGATNFTEVPVAQKGGQLSADKALAFLQNKSIYGHPLTVAQMKSFALAAGVQLDENGDIIEDEDGEPIEYNQEEDAPEGSYEKRGGSTRGRRTSKNIQSSINKLLARNTMLYGPSGKHNLYDPKYDDGGSTMPYVHYEKAGQVPAWSPEQYKKVHAGMKDYPSSLPAYNPGYGIPHTGVVIDKRTNKAYYTGNKGEKGSFNVLTGKNPELNSNLESLEYLDKHPEMRNTPKGYYLMHPQEPLNEYTKKHYKGMVRPLTPIPAYGMKAPKSDAIAFHRVYADQANDPNDSEYNRRMRLINQSNATLRCGSYGCANVAEESYNDVNRALPGTDTTLVIDSRNHNDLMKLRYIQEQMKNKKKQGGLAFPQQPTADQFYARGYVPNVPSHFYREGGMTNGIAFPQQPGADMFFSGYPFQPEYAQGGMPCMDCGGYMDDGGQASPFGYGQFPPAMGKGGQAAFVKAMQKYYAEGGQAPQGSDMEQNYMTDTNALKKFIGGNVMNDMASGVYGEQPAYDMGGENTFNQGQFDMINSVQQGYDYSQQQAQNQRMQAMQSLGDAAMYRARYGGLPKHQTVGQVAPFSKIQPIHQKSDEFQGFLNTNAGGDSVAVYENMIKFPNKYGNTKVQYEMNKDEDKIANHRVNPQTGKLEPAPFVNYPTKMIDALSTKQAMANVWENNHGDGTPLYDHLYGYKTQEELDSGKAAWEAQQEAQRKSKNRSMTNRAYGGMPEYGPGGQSTKADYDAWMKKAEADYYANQSGQGNPDDHTKGAVNNVYYVDNGRQSRGYNPGYKVKARGWSGDQGQGNQWKSKGYSDSPFPNMGSGFMGQGQPQGSQGSTKGMTPQQINDAKKYWADKGMDFEYTQKQGLIGRMMGLDPRVVKMSLKHTPGSTASMNAAGEYNQGAHDTGTMPTPQNTISAVGPTEGPMTQESYNRLHPNTPTRGIIENQSNPNKQDMATWLRENIGTTARPNAPEEMVPRTQERQGFDMGGMPSMYLPYGYQTGGMPSMGKQSDNDEDDYEYMDEQQIAAFMAAGGVIEYVK